MFVPSLEGAKIRVQVNWFVKKGFPVREESCSLLSVFDWRSN